MSKVVFIPGGFGYIGKHTCIELLNNGYIVIVADNKPIEQLNSINNNIEKITSKKVIIVNTKIDTKEKIRSIFNTFSIDIVIHLAGIKTAMSFYSTPVQSYKKELTLTMNLLLVMDEFKIKNIIFPSSILVYSSDNSMPLTEISKLNITNPYARNKIFIEGLLNDLYLSDNEWNIVILRYSNTVGVHNSGLIKGHTPKVPNNLTSSIMAVLSNKTKEVKVFGDNFNTEDGTAQRDFTHVVDVAKATQRSANYIMQDKLDNVCILNISSGKSHSVLEVIKSFEDITNEKISYKIFPARKSDIPISYSDNSLAKKILNWTPQFDLNDICKDLYKSQSQ
jgi:UDP-glucose 4-epimerase